jgi:tetratricopeptide (TPR) repeat protein
LRTLMEVIMYRRPLGVGAAFVLLLMTTTGAAAQAPGRGGTSTQVPAGHVSSPQDALSTASITVNVTGPDHRPLKQQAFVTLYKMGSGVPIGTLMTERSSEAVFSNMPGYGWYTVGVSAAGYTAERKDVAFDSTYTRVQVDITMHPLSGADATSTPAPTLPPKVQKHVQKGLEAMQAGKLPEAQKELIAAYNAAPKNADVCYLLGVAYLKSKDFPHAQSYLEMAPSLDPKNVPALVALGQLHHQQKDYEAAIAPLEKAVSLDPKEWLARWMLSDIYLRGGEYEKARQDAEEAVELGKGAANKAELIEGQALAQLGRRDDAIKELQAFLHDMPGDPAAPTVQGLIAKLQSSTPDSPRVPAASEQVGLPSPSLAPDVDVSSFLVPDWQPPSVDVERPAIAEGLACPADHVIEEAGKRVAELVDSVNRIAATEDILYEDLSSLGRPISTYKRRYDYEIMISESSPGMMMINEDRSGDTGPQKYPQHMAPFALAELAMIFHPQMRNDFQMNCEGLGKWQSQATWLVYFRQRADRPQRIRSYEGLDGSYSSGLKGRAWISADTFQIARLEAELMTPIPQIGLGSERDVIEYGLVPFQKQKAELWLPMNAEIFFYYRHHPYHRRHTFSNYMLFSVSASQKIGQLPKPTEEK